MTVIAIARNDAGQLGLVKTVDGRAVFPLTSAELLPDLLLTTVAPRPHDLGPLEFGAGRISVHLFHAGPLSDERAVRWHTPEQLTTLIQANFISDGLTVAAFAKLAAAGI